MTPAAVRQAKRRAKVLADPELVQVAYVIPRAALDDMREVVRLMMVDRRLRPAMLRCEPGGAGVLPLKPGVNYSIKALRAREQAGWEAAKPRRAPRKMTAADLGA